MTELLEEENTNLSTSHEHAHLISMYTSLNSLIFVSLSPFPPPPPPVFGLGLACQAKGHSNRIPTFRPCHVFTEITEKKKTEEKCEPQHAKHISALQKQARGNKNIFSVEHDS